jgi:tricorn protease
MQARGFFLQVLAFFLLYQCTAADAADQAGTRLLRQPSLSRDHLAFVFGGDIWISDRDGHRPVRITAHPASEFAPHISPDGRWIAFSAAYDNNTDVYVVSVEGVNRGGLPGTRLRTWLRAGAPTASGYCLLRIGRSPTAAVVSYSRSPSPAATRRR